MTLRDQLWSASGCSRSTAASSRRLRPRWPRRRTRRSPAAWSGRPPAAPSPQRSPPGAARARRPRPARHGSHVTTPGRRGECRLTAGSLQAPHAAGQLITRWPLDHKLPSMASRRSSRWPCAGRGQAGQVGADLPEPCRGGLVVAAPGGSPGFAAGEVAACHLLQSGSGNQVDGRGGAPARGLHEGPHERGEQPLDATRVRGSERCAHHAGMQRIGGDQRGLRLRASS